MSKEARYLVQPGAAIVIFAVLLSDGLLSINIFITFFRLPASMFCQCYENIIHDFDKPSDCEFVIVILYPCSYIVHVKYHNCHLSSIAQM